MVGPIMLLLGGAMVSVFGVRMAVRSRVGLRLLGRWRWWALSGYYLMVGVIVAAGFVLVIRILLEDAGRDEAITSPWLFLVFGVVVGLPLTLHTVTGVWRQQVELDRLSKEEKKPASRQQRLDFATDLEKQVQEYAGDGRSITVALSGEGGKILSFNGQLTREQGERLVAALRADITKLDFLRVEGAGDGGKWWVRV